MRWVNRFRRQAKQNHEPVEHRVTVGSFVINKVQLVAGDKPFEKPKEETVDHKDDTEYGACHRAYSQGATGKRFGQG